MLVNQTSFKKGHEVSDEWREISRHANLGNKHHLGHLHSDETKQKISMSKRGKTMGENNPNWKGGTYGTERHQAMGRIDYSLWRTAVFMRDDYTCQTCNERGGELNADHIKPWSLYPELRYAIDNGRTLCISCHRQTDTWGGKVHSVERDLG